MSILINRLVHEDISMSIIPDADGVLLRFTKKDASGTRVYEKRFSLEDLAASVIPFGAVAQLELNEFLEEYKGV